jgi:regulator of protease activity HflC (stomatin/prohibitin superfamily)
MDSALSWIGTIAGWVGQFFPRLEIVTTTHGAVKWVKGSKVIALGPGWHWYWPFTTKFESYPTARQAVDLRSQTITTADDKTIIAGGLIIYEIKDIEAICAHTFDADETIADICLSAVHDVLCTKSWAEIRDAQRSGNLDRDLRVEVRKSLDSYGVRVLKMTLTDLAPCRVIKLLQSTSHDGLDKSPTSLQML